ncbi:hypothetical protein CRUP_018300 [Coryphaenoides rupestris]|nr:hypothetical protein CRUP_018300 [Coryphaenoides rupestris]
MSNLPGNPGYSVVGDKSLEFYKDPVGFCDHRLDKHCGGGGGGGCRVFQSRLLNKPTAFVCSCLGTELVLGLFLNVHPEEQPQLYQEISELCTQHWHGLISAPVSLKVPMWSSGFSIALEARAKLMDIIKDKLENDKHGNAGQEHLLCCLGNGPRNCIGAQLTDSFVKPSRSASPSAAWTRQTPTAAPHVLSEAQ